MNSTTATLQRSGLGPQLIKHPSAILVQREDTVFDCPIAGPVAWEAKDVFNPAAVVRNGKVYRAEDRVGQYAGTSRIGLAVSEDGVTFQRHPVPVLYPDNDAYKSIEWEGGIEDPRVVEAPDGRYLMTYTAFDGVKARLCVAESTDLYHWQKRGPAFARALHGKHRDRWTKSGAIVCRLAGDRLVATPIAGRFWMYFGESDLFCATSEDLVNWEPVEHPFGSDRKVVSHVDAMYETKGWESAREPLPVLTPRRGRFDSVLVEPGPPPVLTDEGIIVYYNSCNCSQRGDSTLRPGTYAAGRAVFDPCDPTALIERCTRPLLFPELPFERIGQTPRECCFAEGLVWFGGQWNIYYGGADSGIGRAVTPTL